MGESCWVQHVWVVTRLLPLGVPVVTRHRLVRRLPAGGAVVRENGREKTIRLARHRQFFAAEADATRAAAELARQARSRVEDALKQLDRAGVVRDVPE